MLAYFPAIMLHSGFGSATPGLAGRQCMAISGCLRDIQCSCGCCARLSSQLWFTICDPAPFGIGHRNVFVFVDASTGRGSSNRVYPRCDSIAFRRSSLSRAHCHGRSLDDLLDRGGPLGGHLWASSRICICGGSSSPALCWQWRR